MGVDTNQVELYSDHANVEDRFITSALKKLKKAITDALEIWNKKEPQKIKEWFSGTTLNRAQEWIGIAPNKTFTKSNINNLIQKLTPHFNTLSEWWWGEIVAHPVQGSTFKAYNKIEAQTSLKEAFNKLSHISE